MKLPLKIYVDDKPIIITRTSKLREEGHSLILHNMTPDHMWEALQAIVDPGIDIVFICDDHIDVVSDVLKKVFRVCEAAGGVVQNQQGQILMIYRLGKWDLPKGKWDDGETITECALREVHEETGLSGMQLLDKLTDTYHVYEQGGHTILKRTHWYGMSVQASTSLNPQQEEGISEVRWVSPEQLPSLLTNTYANIREVLEKNKNSK